MLIRMWSIFLFCWKLKAFILSHFILKPLSALCVMSYCGSGAVIQSLFISFFFHFFTSIVTFFFATFYQCYIKVKSKVKTARKIQLNSISSFVNMICIVDDWECMLLASNSYLSAFGKLQEIFYGYFSQNHDLFKNMCIFTNMILTIK